MHLQRPKRKHRRPPLRSMHHAEWRRDGQWYVPTSPPSLQPPPLYLHTNTYTDVNDIVRECSFSTTSYNPSAASTAPPASASGTSAAPNASNASPSGPGPMTTMMSGTASRPSGMPSNTASATGASGSGGPGNGNGPSGTGAAGSGDGPGNAAPANMASAALGLGGLLAALGLAL